MTLYVYCAYPAMPKSKKKNTLQNGLKRAETIVVLIVYNRYLSSVALHESGTRKSSLGLWLNNTEVHLTTLLVLNITQQQDIMILLRDDACIGLVIDKRLVVITWGKVETFISTDILKTCFTCFLRWLIKGCCLTSSEQLFIYP